VEKTIEDFVRGLGLDAYLVGGAVRDEQLELDSKDADFVVPGVDYDGLRAALEPHGKVEDVEVAGRRVGARLYPRDGRVRALAPGGIEFAPPRTERSTGPGRHDFEIVADAGLSIEDDMRRRDFTVNAMARRLSTGELVDPCGGVEDLRNRVLRTVGPNSFAEDPLRIVRGLRFVSQLGFEPDEQTVRQMHEEARAVALVSGERIGGGLAADGMGELSKLLLGDVPRRALRLARDTGVLVAVLPEYEAAIGYDPNSDGHRLTLDEHIFTVVQGTADAGTALRVRLAALFHDIGKPVTQGAGGDHAAVAAELADPILRRLRYPNDLRERVVKIIRFHPFLLGSGDALEARKMLALHGEGLVLDLLDHWEADVRARDADERRTEKLERIARFRVVVAGELTSPHRLADLAVDGTDLMAIGFEAGPRLGEMLARLLEIVVEEPSLNRRDMLLARSREWLNE
jgi:putative nucleotidyltransferase with HDIG domain